MSNAPEFSDATFQQEVLEATVPVLVDFWAPWCGPCLRIAPMVDELVAEYGDTVKIGKVNIDDNPGVAQQFSVFSIPTLILFKDGQPVEKFVGVQPKARIKTGIDQHV